MQIAKCCLLIGNSRWHWAIEKENSWHFFHTDPDAQRLKSSELSLVSWAAVGPVPSENLLSPDDRLQIKDIPIKNLPTWLGIDRALAGWQAFKLAKASSRHESGLIVADAGTVLSITLINSNGQFDGGQLTAGLRLQLSAMAQGAYNLKNPGPGYSSRAIAKFPLNTDEAMQRGSLQALVGTLTQAVKEKQMPLWLCGGDAPLLLEELKQNKLEVIHYPNLVLEGMVDLHRKINQDQDL